MNPSPYCAKVPEAPGEPETAAPTSGQATAAGAPSPPAAAPASTTTTSMPALILPKPLKLDLGCGKAKKEGFIGVDVRPFEGVDVVCDLGDGTRWPWADEIVDEAHCSHLLEHFTPNPRIHFVNELWRVLKKGAKCTIVVPHWASCRAYGDLTHQWPPVTEFWFPYLNAKWRAENAPHEDRYTCDFDTTQPGYSLHDAIRLRAADYQQYALTWFREAAQDMICTLVKK